MCSMVLSMAACKTVYSDMYSYRKNYFVDYEARAYADRQAEELKKQGEAARVAADRAARAQSEQLNSAGGALQMDSGLGSPSSSIPGLGGSPAPSSIPGLGGAPSTIPGLDAPTPMSGGDTMGAPGMSPGGGAPKPSTTLPGL